MPITSQVADTLTMTGYIELAVEDRILEYIQNYTSDIPLSKEWVKKKGNDQFFLYSGSTYATVFSFNGTVRAFLPNGEPSFDDNGDTTDYFCEWVRNIVLEVLEEFV